MAQTSAAFPFAEKMRAESDGVVLVSNRNRTIREVKARVQEAEGHPMELIRMHANGVEHTDHKTLAECEISCRTDVRVELLVVSKVKKIEVHTAAEMFMAKRMNN